MQKNLSKTPVLPSDSYSGFILHKYEGSLLLVNVIVPYCDLLEKIFPLGTIIWTENNESSYS